MSLSRLNLVLALLLGLVAVLLFLMRVDNSRPNFQVNLGDDMTFSPAYKAFEANRNFENGRTLQAPVLGTIARGRRPFHFEPTPQDAVSAGEQLQNPFGFGTEAGIAAAERGQVAYRIFCTACHGRDGSRNGPVAQRGFPPPPSLLTGKSRQMKDGQLFHILTLGQNSMPQFAAQLSPERRWEVITYLRQLQQKAEVSPPPTQESGEDTQADVVSPEQHGQGEKP